MKFEWWISSRSGRRGLFPPDKVPNHFHEKADGTEDLCINHSSHVPDFSGSKIKVWLIIEQCKKEGIHFLIQSHNNCVIAYQESKFPGVIDGSSIDLLHFGSFGETLPRSICEAAMEAIEASQKKPMPPLSLEGLKKLKKDSVRSFRYQLLTAR